MEHDDTLTEANKFALRKYKSIANAMECLEIDFDRYVELEKAQRSLLWHWDGTRNPPNEYSRWEEDEGPELFAMQNILDGASYKSKDDVLAEIAELPYRVRLRSGWEEDVDDFEAEEFCIDLTHSAQWFNMHPAVTRTPVVSIVGTLAAGQPDVAWLEYSDIGVSGMLTAPEVDQDVLIAFATKVLE
jgi:hypothetical protein